MTTLVVSERLVNKETKHTDVKKQIIILIQLKFINKNIKYIFFGTRLTQYKITSHPSR